MTHPTMKTASTEREEPLFSCSDGYCRVECSYPANMLAMLNGKPICQGCYEENPPWDPVEWNALPRFVPEYQRRISELEAEIAKLKDQDHGRA